MRALIAHAERWLAAVVIRGAAAAAVDSALAPVVAGDHVTTTEFDVQGSVFGTAGGSQYSPSGLQTVLYLYKLFGTQELAPQSTLN